MLSLFARVFGRSPSNAGRDLYLDLIKRTLANLIYEDDNVFEGRRSAFDERLRVEGRDWPSRAHTMVGLKRLENLQFCVEDVLRRAVPGDLMEAGVWRGGAAIFMRALLKVYGVTDRRVWVADSFKGLPAPNPAKYPLDTGSNLHEFDVLSVPLEEVQKNFRRYGLLDDQVRFLKGWFRETLPNAPVERLAVLRIDGDLYESTTDVLSSMYPKLQVGGYVIIDDYNDIPACRQAVLDYRNSNRIEDEIRTADWPAVYWMKSG